MLGSFLSILSQELTDSSPGKLGIPPTNPMVKFIRKDKPNLQDYLRLDDTSVWSLLEATQSSSNAELASLAARILNRHLYKCVDIGARLREPTGDMKYRFQERLKASAKSLGLVWGRSILQDEPRLSGYDWYNWNEENAVKKVLVQDAEHNENVDIGDKSDIIKSLRKVEFFRLYVPDDDSRKKIEDLWKGDAR